MISRGAVYACIAVLAATAACRSTPGYSDAEGVTPPQPAQEKTEGIAPETDDPQEREEPGLEETLENERTGEEDPEMMGQMTAQEAQATRNIRRDKLLERLGDSQSPMGKLLKADDYGGAEVSGRAIEAYADGSNLKALLLAQAAIGADPGNKTRHRLLSILQEKTGLRADPDGLLPLADLIQYEFKNAETSFFNERYGAAVQHCRRVLLLDEENAAAWTRLGSAHYAAGAKQRAREAYRRALELDPDNPALRTFLIKRGW